MLKCWKITWTFFSIKTELSESEKRVENQKEINFLTEVRKKNFISVQASLYVPWWSKVQTSRGKSIYSTIHFSYWGISKTTKPFYYPVQ